MALFAIAYASFKRLGIWKKCDLDVILMNGNQLCKTLDRTGYVCVTNLPETFQVGSVQDNVEYNTVESLQSGHHSFQKKVSALWRCPLYRMFP